MWANAHAVPEQSLAAAATLQVNGLAGRADVGILHAAFERVTTSGTLLRLLGRGATGFGNG